MVDLSAAIRATAEAARDQAIAQVDADIAQVVEAIRGSAKEGEDVLRVRSDEDIASIKEWSRAEIARIKQETESRIDARKLGLDEQLAAHAAAIEQRVGEVEDTVIAYRAEMDAYTGRLATEEDPARLATMAESMPEPPVLGAFTGLDDFEPASDPVEVEATLVAGELEGPAEVVATQAAEPSPWGEPETPVEWVQPERAWGTTTELVTENTESDAGADALAAVDVEAAADAAADAEILGDGSEAWTSDEPVDDVPHWASGDTPEGFPEAGGEGGEAGDPVDRGAIMAALEAAAEAVVAAESAAESADQAEAAADVAETAAELLKGRVDSDEDYDPEAQAALSARVGAGGFEESYTDRLASLMPNHGEGAADGEPRTTQVIVAGLVSVASIASFKRHLGRLSGVHAVAVASGPDGEFVFNVTHRADVSFRDAVPTMPGFAARVASTADGVVHVTARDPETEG
jgi:hypothetical protein